MIRKSRLQKLRESPSIVDEMMGIYREAAEICEQALVAMGHRIVPDTWTVASTKGVMYPPSDLSSTKAKTPGSGGGSHFQRPGSTRH